MRIPYIQTWHYVCRLPKPGQVTIKKVCNAITGHDWSKTESGYAGGEMLDVWCRWCNHHSTVPIAEMPSKQYLRDLFNEGQDIQ